VPQTDDPTTMAFTVRAVLIGTFWSMLISVANTVFSFRSNVLAIGADIATILSYPMGAAWARFIPIGILNPGPFTLKEHALIYIMASCSTTPYGIENVVTQVYSKFMGNTSISFGHSLGFVLVTQFLGYGLSGLCRRFLVKPKAM
ncbi:OPT oligopeptide transporter protein-domain-containing protein, partial [Obelidium mucronatum]